MAHVFCPFPSSCLQGSGAREMYQFWIASVTMITNTTAYDNVNLLSYISLGQKSDMSVIRKIKGSAELCSLLENLRVNPCPCLFQLPEATHIHCLMAPYLHLQSQQQCISPTALSQSHLPLTLFFWLPPLLLRILWLHWAYPNNPRIIALFAVRRTYFHL